MPSSTPPNLAEILADVLAFKAQYLALKGSLTYAKASLTRKLNSELQLDQTSKPCVDSTGPELTVQQIQFNTNYKLFLAKSPSWLTTFEEACDSMLKFLSTCQPEDATLMGKIEEYVEYVVAEEDKYKSDFTTNNTIILSFYLTNGLGEQVSPTPAASGVVIKVKVAAVPVLVGRFVSEIVQTCYLII